MFDPSTSGLATIEGPALHDLLADLGVPEEILSAPLPIAIDPAGIVHRTRCCVLTAGEHAAAHLAATTSLTATFRDLPAPRCACFVAEQLSHTRAIHLAHWALLARQVLPPLSDLDAALARALRIRQLQFILRGLRSDVALASVTLSAPPTPDPLAPATEALSAEVRACYHVLREELSSPLARRLLSSAPEVRAAAADPSHEALLAITHYRPHELPYAGSLPDACVLAWWDEMPVLGCFSLVVPAPVAELLSTLPLARGRFEYELVVPPRDAEVIATARRLWNPGSDDPHASMRTCLHSARLLLEI